MYDIIEILKKHNTNYKLALIDNKKTIIFKWIKESKHKIIDEIRMKNVELREEKITRYCSIYSIVGSNDLMLIEHQVKSHVQLPKLLLKEFRTKERLYYIDTKTNKIMAIVNIEDLYGSMEVIVFENVYQRAGNCLLEDNIVYIEGRISIKEEDQTITIIASNIQNFDMISESSNTAGNSQAELKRERKELIINITNLTDEQKDKLRGALKFFSGDKNNVPVQILNNENKMPAGGIYLNEMTLKELSEIVGSQNIVF